LFGIKDLEEFLFIFGLSVFFLFVTSIISRALVQYKITKFAHDCEYELSKKLIENYLHQPYVWFLNQNSSNLSKNVLLEVSQVVNQYLIPAINIFVQSIVIIIIFIILFIVDYLFVVILSSVFILSFGLTFILIKKFLLNLGSEAARANKERFYLVTEMLSGIKELKVRGLEQFYINRFDNPAKIYSNNQSLAQILGFIPRYLLEAIGFGSIIILILVLMSKGKNFQNIIPLITLYAFAGYRLLPSIQIIYASITQIRYSKKITINLMGDLIHIRSKNDSSINNSILFNEYFELKNINFSYPNQKNILLKNIDIRISYLSRVGIIGDSGSGKTTLIDLITGLFDPIEGELIVDGKIIEPYILTPFRCAV
jgi:ABC-type bacteriocin/lantibiotic exporter with double-glycine peptidase domain